MKLYFASGNEHKKLEMSRLLGGFELTLPKEEGIEFDVDENGSSFIENAIIKAKALYDIVKAPILSDDSGLIVDALGGEPGIHTARYGEEEAGRKLTAKEKYMLLLKNMEGIKEREARFTAALCLMLSPTRIYVIEEDMDGKIATSPSGENGFGYDPVFYINDAKSIAAELKEGEKDKYSHRSKAARCIKMLLEKEFNDRKK